MRKRSFVIILLLALVAAFFIIPATIDRAGPVSNNGDYQFVIANTVQSPTTAALHQSAPMAIAIRPYFIEPNRGKNRTVRQGHFILKCPINPLSAGVHTYRTLNPNLLLI